MSEQIRRPRENDPDSGRGLYRKFRVERVKESDKHRNCEYYVLDMDHDAFAEPALLTYAAACQDKYPQLAADLRSRYGATAEEPRPEPTREWLIGEIAAKVRRGLREGGYLTPFPPLSTVDRDVETIVRNALRDLLTRVAPEQP